MRTETWALQMQEVQDLSKQLQATQRELEAANVKLEDYSVNLTRLQGEHEANKSALDRTASEAQHAAEKSSRLEKRAHELQEKLQKTGGELKARACSMHSWLSAAMHALQPHELCACV